jgi:hypothetical protein
LEFSIPLNKFEKHDLILKLLCEGKIYRDICHIAHVNPRTIKPIEKEYERKKRLENKKGELKNQIIKPPSLSTQAFILYQEGKKIDEAKVLLNIPFKQAMIFWEQYLKSIKMYECFEFYELFQYDLPRLLPISSFMKRNNVSGLDILNVLRTAKYVSNLNQIYLNLKTETKYLEQKRTYLQDYSRSPYSLQPLPLNKSKYHYYSY